MADLHQRASGAERDNAAERGDLQALVAARRAPVEGFFAKAGLAIIWSANLLHGGDHHRDLAQTRWSQVTHYVFEGCAYYTPLLSDPYTGSIFFREPVDMVTGQARKNVSSGVATPRRFMRETMPGGSKMPLRRTVLRRLKGRQLQGGELFRTLTYSLLLQVCQP